MPNNIMQQEIPGSGMIVLVADTIPRLFGDRHCHRWEEAKKKKKKKEQKFDNPIS